MWCRNKQILKAIWNRLLHDMELGSFTTHEGPWKVLNLVSVICLQKQKQYKKSLNFEHLVIHMAAMEPVTQEKICTTGCSKSWVLKVNHGLGWNCTRFSHLTYRFSSECPVGPSLSWELLLKATKVWTTILFTSARQILERPGILTCNICKIPGIIGHVSICY